MSDATRERLRALVNLLRRHPEGLTTPEIGDELHVTRQTALKDIERLTHDGYPVYEEGARYLLDSGFHQEITLSLPQAWFLYLPLRRIVRADLHRLPLVRTLLHQIASLFHSEIADQLVPQRDEADDQAINSQFVELVSCWQKQCHAQIMYQRPNTSRATKLIVAAWWFEPAVWSDAFYLIGGLQKQDGTLEPITLKLDRIRLVKRLNSRFERPSGEEITAYLEKTWGIWVGDEEPVMVKLRFHNRQLDRLRETRWHPTQQMSIDADGYILWQATISEPHEMLPWIRGWGADVEVLEPDNLREQIASEAEATVRLYRQETSQPRRFF